MDEALITQLASIVEAATRGARASVMPARSEFRDLGVRVAPALKMEDLDALYEILRRAHGAGDGPTVAYLGPEGTFSHQAALDFTDAAGCGIACPTFRSVADSVHRGTSNWGVLPVENSIEGVVGASLDLVFQHHLLVYAELVLPIHLTLVGEARSLVDVTSVVSHPQALRQCEEWLATHLPDATVLPVESTAGALTRVRGYPDRVAIVGPLVARSVPDLVIADSIEDASDNRTRFWLIGPPGLPEAPRAVGDRVKTSVAFIVVHEPGSLTRALAALSKEGVNLDFIVSRWVRGMPLVYCFYIDLVGGLSEPRVAKALAALDQATYFSKVLGTYRSSNDWNPQAELPADPGHLLARLSGEAVPPGSPEP
jgi:chorismate mutase / prephenate dehydratase